MLIELIIFFSQPVDFDITMFFMLLMICNALPCYIRLACCVGFKKGSFSGFFVCVGVYKITFKWIC